MARGEQRRVLDLPEDVRTVADWRAFLADLSRQEAELEGALERVRAERRERALHIARGDPAALKRNAELNAEQVEVLNRLDLLTVIRSAAQEKLGAAEAAETEAEAAARRERLRGRAEAADRLASEVDAAACKLSDAFAAYRAEVSAMIPDGLDSGIVNKLRNRTKLLGAMHAAGLHQHLVLDRVPALHHETLRAWTGRMLAGALGEFAPEQPATPAEAA